MRWAIVMLALISTPVHASFDERQIRRDCTYDALRYCKTAILRADRSTIINCMLANREKLQAKCTRHFY